MEKEPSSVNDMIDYYHTLKESFKKSPTPAIQNEMKSISEEILYLTGAESMAEFDEDDALNRMIDNTDSTPQD